jgi:hypothetical protein
VCVPKTQPGRNDGEPAEGLKLLFDLHGEASTAKTKQIKRDHRANLADSSLNQPG